MSRSAGSAAPPTTGKLLPVARTHDPDAAVTRPRRPSRGMHADAWAVWLGALCVQRCTCAALQAAQRGAFEGGHCSPWRVCRRQPARAQPGSSARLFGSYLAGVLPIARGGGGGGDGSDAEVGAGAYPGSWLGRPQLASSVAATVMRARGLAWKGGRPPGAAAAALSVPLVTLRPPLPCPSPAGEGRRRWRGGSVGGVAPASRRSQGAHESGRGGLPASPPPQPGACTPDRSSFPAGTLQGSPQLPRPSCASPPALPPPPSPHTPPASPAAAGAAERQQQHAPQQHPGQRHDLRRPPPPGTAASWREAAAEGAQV